jgi:hypothetical protein
MPKSAETYLGNEQGLPAGKPWLEYFLNARIGANPVFKHGLGNFGGEPGRIEDRNRDHFHRPFRDVSVLINFTQH